MTDILAYTPETAAAASRIGRTKLFQAIKEGRLRARKSGRRTIILAADLNEFLASLPERRPVGRSAPRRLRSARNS